MTTLHRNLVLAIIATFVVIVSLEDIVRDDVSVTRHWISHLSLGAWGWINIGALAVLGATVVTTAPAVGSGSGRWAARWVTTTGVGLTLAAFFVSDPPPGTAYPESTTWHGQLHDLGGGLTFVGLFATAVTTRRLVRPPWGALSAALIAAAWLAASAMAVISFTDDGPNLPGGLAERVAIGVGLVWLATVATTITQRTTHELPGLPEHDQVQDGTGSRRLPATCCRQGS
jgi:hypothetical protein